MIQLNQLKQHKTIYKAFIEVREYHIVYIGDEFVYIKQVDDIELTKVFKFEFITSLYHSTREEAKEWIGSNNNTYGVTSSAGIYNRLFTLPKDYIVEGNVFYEIAHGGSQFTYKKQSKMLVIYELEIIKVTTQNNSPVVGLALKEYNTNDAPEIFGGSVENLISSVNIHTTVMGVMSDIVRSKNVIYKEALKLYDNSRILYDSVNDEQKKLIDNEILELNKYIAGTNNAYENFLAKVAQHTSSNTIEQDAISILNKLGES